MQGIKLHVLFPADNGDEAANTSVKQADYPASDPYITSVGGTSAAIGADGTFEFQTGWGTQRYSLNPTQSGWDFTAFMYGSGGRRVGAVQPARLPEWGSFRAASVMSGQSPTWPWTLTHHWHADW